MKKSQFDGSQIHPAQIPFIALIFSTHPKGVYSHEGSALRCG